MAAMTHAAISGQPLDIPDPGRYQINPERSTVTIRTRHLFGLGTVRATLALRDGCIQVTTPPEASTVQARFAASTFRSGNQARDAAVLSPRLLGAEAYPRLSFTSTELARQHGQWSLRGRLTVRDASRLVEARINTLENDGTTLLATAQVTIDRYDFGITAYRGLAARMLTIGLVITAHREIES